jgi:hypothetical protein
MEVEFDSEGGVNTSDRDAVEVKIPAKLQRLMNEIKKTRSKLKQALPSQKRDLNEQMTKVKALAEAEKIESKYKNMDTQLEKDLFAQVTHSLDMKHLQLQNNDIRAKKPQWKEEIEEIDTKKTSQMFYRNEEFNVAVFDHVDFLIKNEQYDFYIMFIEFQSFNINEMNQYKLDSAAYKDKLKENSFVLKIEAEMEMEAIIEDVDRILKEALTETARFTKQELSRENPLRVIIYFEKPFYLSEVKLSHLIKFIEEVHLYEGVRYFLVFKKAEDIKFSPINSNCLFSFLPYDKDNSMFYTMLFQIVTQLHLTFDPDFLLYLMIDFENNRDQISLRSSQLQNVFKIHGIYNPEYKSELSSISKDKKQRKELIAARTTSQAGLSFFKILFESRTQEKDSRFEDALILYCDPEAVDFPQFKDLKNNKKSKVGRSIMTIKSFVNYRTQTLDTVEAFVENTWTKIKKCFTQTFESGENRVFFAQEKLKDLKLRLEVLDKEIERSINKNSMPKPVEAKRRQKEEISRDNEDRIKKIQNAGIGIGEETSHFVDQLKKLAVEFLKVLHRTLIADHLRFIKEHHSSHYLQDYPFYESLINPDVQGNYVQTLLRLSPSNALEHAIQIMFLIIADETAVFKVYSLYLKFKGEFGRRTGQQDLKIINYFFHYSLTIFKYTGLINEQSKSRKIMNKTFFKKHRGI